MQKNVDNKINKPVSNVAITAGLIAGAIFSPLNQTVNNTYGYGKTYKSLDTNFSPSTKSSAPNEGGLTEIPMFGNLYGSLKQNADYIEVSTELKNFKNSTVETIGKMETASNSQYRTLVDTLKSIETKIDLLPSKEYVDGKISESETRTIKWVIATGISVIVLAFGVFTWYSNSTTTLIKVILNELQNLKK